MFKRLSDWLDSRTGYKAALHEALDEPIPGGARWRYVWGSALTSTFLIQLVTGLLLMFSYSPSATTAWGSVFYINYEMTGGWVLRGVHHFGSQAMVVLLAFHLIQVLWAGAYRAPREVNWWFGMALLFVTLGFSLTGYLLPWDQKGYWATKVATNIMGGAPGIGPYLQKVVVGGADYGNATLTRFYGLHVGVLPALLVLCLAGHIALFRRHGVTAPRNARGEGRFWPEQVFLDTVVSVGVLAVLFFLVWREGGANLDAPADPASDYPARPEWYFLSLFQLLKLFPGEREVIGTVVVPGAIVAVLMVLPLLDRVFPGKVAHFLACMVVFALVGGAGYLTLAALSEDATNQKFQTDRQQADQARERALLLAKTEGLPPEGSAYLLLRDPLYHGRAVLEAKCLGCHNFGGARKGTGTMLAADLKGFGTEAWVRGLLEDPDDPAFFGGIKGCDPKLSGMAQWKKGSGAKLTPAQLDELAKFVASFAAIAPDTPVSVWQNDPKVAEHPTFALFNDQCATCHVLGEVDEASFGPNLFGWGSETWFRRIVRQPGAPDLYGLVDPKCQMPAFADQLTDNDLTTLYRYVRGDYPGEAPPPLAAPKALRAKAARP